MTDDVTIPAARLAELERISDAAQAWLYAWSAAQTSGNTVSAFEYSKKLATVVRSANG